MRIYTKTARTYRTPAFRRKASAKWYAKNRRRHITAVQARYRAVKADGAGRYEGPPASVAEARERAAILARDGIEALR